MTKLLGWIFIVFFVLVGFNYLATAAGNFSAARHLWNSYGYGGAASASNDQGLPSVDLAALGLGTPTGRLVVTQGYGRTSFAYAYIGDWHNGIDIAAVYGAPIYSPAVGTILATGNQDSYCPGRGFGKYIAVMDDKNGLVLWFAHLGKIAVAAGDAISRGTLIGTIGATGFETGTHLHFSIFKAAGFSMTSRNGCGPDPTGRDVNPLSYLGTVY